MTRALDANLVVGLQQRESGVRITSWENTLHRRRISSVTLSATRFFDRANSGGVTWLDLESIEQRYLLAGSLLSEACDSNLAIYDTQAYKEKGAGPGAEDGQQGGARPGAARGQNGSGSIPAVVRISRSQPGAHKHSVSGVAWYPVDTGLFVSSSLGGEVKAWDTNTSEAVCTFELVMPARAVAMSHVATTHSLVAAACEDGAVYLCDLASGNKTHRLSAHGESVWAVCWSVNSEYELLSGDVRGQVLLWDVRRAGFRVALDQYRTISSAAADEDDDAVFGEGARAVTAAGAAVAAASGRRGRHRRRHRGGGGGGGGLTAGASPPTAFAHDGTVTCLLAVPDGGAWLSGGKDQRVRLWDTRRARNLLLHYPNTFNSASRARQMAVTGDSRCFFHPSGSAVQVLEVWSGAELAVLREGHHGTVNAVAWSDRAGELYSGATDGQLLAWGIMDAQLKHLRDSERDDWSDDY